MCLDVLNIAFVRPVGTAVSVMCDLYPFIAWYKHLALEILINFNLISLHSKTKSISCKIMSAFATVRLL